MSHDEYCPLMSSCDAQPADQEHVIDQPDGSRAKCVICLDKCECKLIAAVEARTRNERVGEICAQCNHSEYEHVIAVDRCNHPAGTDAHCTCTRFEVQL
jgi:hypothetical protein